MSLFGPTKRVMATAALNQILGQCFHLRKTESGCGMSSGFLTKPVSAFRNTTNGGVGQGVIFASFNVRVNGLRSPRNTPSYSSRRKRMRSLTGKPASDTHGHEGKPLKN